MFWVLSPKTSTFLFDMGAIDLAPARPASDALCVSPLLAMTRANLAP